MLFCFLKKYMEHLFGYKNLSGCGPLLCARPASEQLRGISLVTRQPIAFPPRRMFDEYPFYALFAHLTEL